MALFSLLVHNLLFRLSFFPFRHSSRRVSLIEGSGKYKYFTWTTVGALVDFWGPMQRKKKVSHARDCAYICEELFTSRSHPRKSALGSGARRSRVSAYSARIALSFSLSFSLSFTLSEVVNAHAHSCASAALPRLWCSLYSCVGESRHRCTLSYSLARATAGIPCGRQRERKAGSQARGCVCVGTLTVALQSLVYTTDPEAVRVCAFGAHARIRERVSFVALYTPGIIYPLAYIETTFRRITTADDHSCVRLFCLRGYCEWILRFVFVY